MSNKSEPTTKKNEKGEEASSISEEEFEEPPSFSLATLGLQRVGTLPPPKPQTQAPIQMLNARGMPARIRKRNRFFFDDDIINDDKPLRMSLSPRKPSANTTAASSMAKMLAKGVGGTSQTTATFKSPGKGGIKKRKGAAIRLVLPGPSQEKLKKNTNLLVGPTTSKRFGPSTTIKSNIKLHTPTTEMAALSYKPADKELGQAIGMRLRNLLKLPKAHKWVIFEWFYSFVDKPFFEGENDFQICLAENLTNLRTRMLTRREWQKVRSLIGRPRRCSAKFFEEERRELERKRQKVRYIQTRKSGDVQDMNFVRDLPEKIPLPLPVGTLVTARLRLPQDGIFSGNVDAFDSKSSTYRIAFDRNGLGTHPIPDYEIVSENFHEMLPLQSFTKDFRPNLASIFNSATPKVLLSSLNATKNQDNTAASGTSAASAGLDSVRSALNMHLNRSDPLLGQHTLLNGKTVNGYPAKLLETMVRMQRALLIKKTKLLRLGNMNDEAELLLAASAHKANNCNSDSEDSQSKVMPEITEEFQRRYASIIISLEKMNRDMQDYLNVIHLQSNTLSRDSQVLAMLTPSYLREKCREDASLIVKRNNQNQLQNKSIVDLIKGLATVLLVASHLNNDENSTQVPKVLDGCIEEVKSNLSESNIETFQKNVQIHLHHIRLGIGKNMTANSANTTETSTKQEEMDEEQEGSPKLTAMEPEVTLTVGDTDMSLKDSIMETDNATQSHSNA